MLHGRKARPFNPEVRRNNTSLLEVMSIRVVMHINVEIGSRIPFRQAAGSSQETRSFLLA